MLINASLSLLLESEISRHRLPASFIGTISDFYLPLATEISSAVQKRSAGNLRPLMLGVYGSQGSGKSTFAHFVRLLLEEEFALSCVVMSLDDFYLTRKQRQNLAKQVHPLLQTRGVPGTHDTDLLQAVINDLGDVNENSPVKIPVFDKATDDRAHKEAWQCIKKVPQVIILEGWCVGVSPQSDQALSVAVNQLEKDKDPDGVWRRFVNQQLMDNYLPIFRKFDKLIGLIAPSFDCVFEWRVLQEEKLIENLKAAGKSTAKTMSVTDIEKFIAHYERLTTHALASVPETADWCLHINAEHQIVSLIAAQKQG